jgi:hypothetical protein
MKLRLFQTTMLSLYASVGVVYSAVPLDTKTDLYYLSMDACVQAISISAAHTGQAQDPIAILRDGITSDFPDGLGQVEYLDTPALRHRYAKIKKAFPAVAIAPIKNEGDKLIVRCWDYRVSIQKRKIVQGVIGGWDVFWRHDCGNNKYVIEKVNRWVFRVE